MEEGKSLTDLPSILEFTCKSFYYKVSFLTKVAEITLKSTFTFNLFLKYFCIEGKSDSLDKHLQSMESNQEDLLDSPNPKTKSVTLDQNLSSKNVKGHHSRTMPNNPGENGM